MLWNVPPRMSARPASGHLSINVNSARVSTAPVWALSPLYLCPQSGAAYLRDKVSVAHGRLRAFPQEAAGPCPPGPCRDGHHPANLRVEEQVFPQPATHSGRWVTCQAGLRLASD